MALAYLRDVSKLSQPNRTSGREVASLVAESQKFTQEMNELTQARDGIVKSGVDAEA